MNFYRSKLEVRKCETIRVCAGGIVDSIQIGDDERAGGSGGKVNEFTLHKGETIVRVSGTRVRYPNIDSALCIGEIKFETNKGNVHGPFGHSAKGRNRRIEERFDFNCCAGPDCDAADDTPGHRPGLRKISGKSGDYLHCVNCKFHM